MPIKQTLDFSDQYEVKQGKKGPRVHVPLSRGGIWKVDARKLSLMYAAQEMLERENPVTLRRLYYMLFGSGWIDNSQETYSRIIIPTMTEARQRGIIPWHHLMDTTRPPHGIPMWEDVPDFLQHMPGWYNRNVWAGQEVYIEVWVEKRADMPHIMATAHQYNITVNAGNGYDGWSSIHDAHLRLKPHEEADRQCHILYLGDYDPSGLHMAHSLEERLRTFGVAPEFHRLGVNRDDIDEHDLPEWPGKESDPRADWMFKHFGELLQVEMDALPVSVIQTKVSTAIESLLNMKVFREARSLEEEEREALTEALSKLKLNDTSPKSKKQSGSSWKPGDESNW